MTSILGILNVTPDSFSDGGLWIDRDAAVKHALGMVARGADIIDVGGESTRPGAQRVAISEERRRVLPVVRDLVAQGVTVSVDTMNASTAAAAIEAGATIINDVSGGLADPEMDDLIVGSDARFVVMHWRGPSDGMNELARYRDVVAEVVSELELRAAQLIVKGVDPERLILDPGLGFAKNADHNWAVLGRLDRLVGLGLPVLIGASRKRFLGELVPGGATAVERDLASSTVAALAVNAGAWGVRVHDVSLTRGAVDVAEAWIRGRDGGAAAAATGSTAERPGSGRRR
ncbi:dihydropteroate synthase [Herbiconiux flava]|uniref:Dihydropteroate synthase n=1 Tax=Herbiconiux flava TaxID=881268 RepID=A0A852SMX9_9MICO|nr:dihydropteroate synthase [Herbiconiux flava]NYD70181.1 dihydropteroate synthase [Herbiconiux flava]GLK16934.1 dihydropteroate synthase [Herbiconiux flava]